MKFFLLTLSFFIALMVGGIFIYTLPKAEKQIEAQLIALGFTEVKIKKSMPTLTGLRIKNIQLDEDSFNLIKDFEINIFWPTAFLKSDIKNIYIDNIEISLVPSELKKFLSIGTKLKSPHNASFQTLIIEKITVDLALPQKALRFIGDLKLTSNENSYALKGNLNATQHDIAFNTVWTGQIDITKEKFQLDGIIKNLKVNFEPLNINRAQGWVSYTTDKDQNNFALQIDAGSASIFNLATKNLSLIIGQDEGGYPALLRSNFVGLNNATFTSDFYYTQRPSERNFTANLNIPNEQEFIQLLKLQNIIDTDLSLKDYALKNINAEMKYMAEKRFAGGPLPFDVTMNNDLSGAVLIYPDTFDVRGTLNAEANTIQYLANLLSIPEENRSENIIRLDSNLRKLKDNF